MLNEKFLISLQGKNYVTYEGLLDLAHQKGLLSLEVDILQFPNLENDMTAICRASASTDKTRFTDIGDANPRSVNSSLVPHIIRMASTRAKARALRDLTNIGMTSIEELSLDDGLVEEAPAKYLGNQEEEPTKRQLDTIKSLVEDLGIKIDYSKLNKKSAGNLIGQLLEEKKSKT